MKDKPHILVSACLLGKACRYDGKSVSYPALAWLLEKDVVLVPFCPEEAGGLPTPRSPAERVGDRIMATDGRDVTDAFLHGSREALRLCREKGYHVALLKEKSPSCGHGVIYDGSFSRRLTAGNGVTAELFLQNGIRVFGESDIEALLLCIDGEKNP